MKEVKIEVIDVNGNIKGITVEYEGTTMPESLDRFIVEHLGGRPDDR